MPSARSILDRVTYHAAYENCIVDALRWARPGGFVGVQLAETPGLSFENVAGQQVGEIASIVRGEGLRLSLHAADDTNFFAVSPARRDGQAEYFRRLADFAYHAGARIITVHLGGVPTWPTDEDPPRWWLDSDGLAMTQIFAENLQGVLDMLHPPCELCVENVGLDEWHIDQIQPYINDSRVRICWDLAKSYDSQDKLNASQASWAHRNALRIAQVHLHDRRDGQSHRVIGSGCVNFPALLSPLPEVGIDEYVIEVHPREKAAESLENLHRILQPFQAGLD